MTHRAALLVAAVGCASAPVVPVGDVHDFDTFAGAWVFKNKRQKQRGVHSTEFDEFPAVSCTRIYLDAVSNVDEVFFSTKGWAGLTVRTFDKAKKQWSIYWVKPETGVMYPPVTAAFTAIPATSTAATPTTASPCSCVFTGRKRAPIISCRSNRSRTTATPGR